jgi:beta-1,2-mannobiose phosphorylase / 1,2-beta-oligomannan phosphorylase
MIDINRYPYNPILSPLPNHHWEAQAVFNACPVIKNASVYLIYRAMTPKFDYENKNLQLSTIGIAESPKPTTSSAVKFNNRRQFIKPEHEWEKYGCEDPRVTKYKNKYYIFYTALSNYPPDRSSIKVGLAISPDLNEINSKYLITPFNAKAMTMFPEKINGKITAILTVQTDQPPANIAIKHFNKIEDLWNHEKWNEWYEKLEMHTLRLQRRPQDHVEIGAPPIKTKAGWLFIHSYINNYFNEQKRIFNIEAKLLDLKNPRKIIGRSKFPLLIPEKKYELEGNVPNVIFPSGALINENILNIYYGGADTYCCLASCSLNNLLNELTND